jgi:hypothetical protein
VLMAVLTAASFLLVAPAGLMAQTTSAGPPAFNAARTPTSPAFTVMGLEPTSVERPSNPADLALAFLSQVEDPTIVPADFALEVSPYWLVRRPRLTWSADATRTVRESLMRTAAFSIGTGEVGTRSAPVRALAVGVRTSVLSGRLSAESRRQIEELEKRLQAEATLGLRLMAAQLHELNQMLQAGEITKEQFTQLMATLQKATLQSPEYRESVERQAVEKLMQTFATVRDGFFLELAAAAVWRHPGAVWEQGQFDRWGVWATPSYTGRDAAVIGVFRYLSADADAGTAEGVLDFGVRGIHFRDRYGMSLEYVRRTFRAPDLASGYRLVANAEYAIADPIWLVVSFGRDHDTRREGSLIARIGLTISFRKERYLTNETVNSER